MISSRCQFVHVSKSKAVCHFNLDEEKTNTLHQLIKDLLDLHGLGELALDEELEKKLVEVSCYSFCITHAGLIESSILGRYLDPNQKNSLKLYQETGRLPREHKGLISKEPRVDTTVDTLRVFSAYVNFALSSRASPVQEIQAMLMHREERLYVAANTCDLPDTDRLKDLRFKYNARAYGELEDEVKRRYLPVSSADEPGLRCLRLKEGGANYKLHSSCEGAAKDKDTPVFLHGNYYGEAGEDTHAEQGLLLVLAHRLARGDVPLGDVFIAGKKPPCNVCRRVLQAFKRAYEKVYEKSLEYCESKRKFDRAFLNMFDMHGLDSGEAKSRVAISKMKKPIETGLVAGDKNNSPAAPVDFASVISHIDVDERFMQFLEEYGVAYGSIGERDEEKEGT